MKKLFLLSMMCLMALSMQAQRCAVLEFKAGVGISQNDVDGISAIFITYFRPAGYTMVERTQIDRVILEQGFQRSRMTQAQMVRVGEILNVSKIVVGDINVVMGQYNVDARVINVETGTISATEGATFATSNYRASMQSVATKLAAKIAITPGQTVQAQSSVSSSSRTRSSIETVYGYLKVFPNELGEFQSQPYSVIAQINNQAMHGYNNWRLPTDEELSLLRANGYLGGGQYMSKRNDRGIVLLVTDGKDYATLQAEEQDPRFAELKAKGLVDLGLPSGTLWKDKDEDIFCSYEEALNKYGSNMPSKEQFEELIGKCHWIWTGNGYRVTGPNGNSIVLPASGILFVGTSTTEPPIHFGQGVGGEYWSYTHKNPDSAWVLEFNSDKGEVNVSVDNVRFSWKSVRLVQD